MAMTSARDDEAHRDIVSVFIAPPSQRPILAALVDLSSAGLIAPFHWIEADADADVEGLAADPDLVSVSDGQVTASRYSHVVNRHGLRAVRLLVVVPVGHPAEDALTAETELYFHSLGITSTAERECTRVLVPWSPQPLEVELGRVGWNNVMLSPEATADPSYSPTPWWEDTTIIPGAAAVGLAVQAGLCGTVQDAPHDGSLNTSSTYVEVTRSFVRTTDAHAAEDDLRRRVMSMDGRFPRPTRRETGVLLSSYPDPAERITTAAQVWNQRHREKLRRRMAPDPVGADKEIDFLQALKLFLSFMLKAVLGAPGDWLRGQLRSAKAAIASTTGRIVFGQDSPMLVVVGGVDAAGRNAGWRDIMSAAKQASAVMPEDFPRSDQPVRRDFSALWRDLVFGARALVDGSGCTELGLAAYEGYVPDRDVIAPPRDGEGSFTIAETIGSIAAGTTVHAWDRLEIDRIGAELRKVAEANGPHSQTAAQYLARMGQWRARGNQRFLSLIGGFLADSFSRTRRDIASLAAQLKALIQQDLTEQTELRQRRLASMIRILLAVFVVVLIALAVLGALKTMTWKEVGIISIIVFLVWLIASVAVFVSQQREVFRLIAAAQSRDRRLPVINANLRLAIEDLAAQGEAYAQFDRWASVLTSFLTDPLGERDTERTAREHLTRLPIPIQRVEVEADDESLADAAAELRSKVFTVGWAGQAWEALNARMKEDLTPDQRSQLKSRQLEMFSESGAEGSALSNWAEGLASKGVRSAAGADHWATCLRLLDGEEGGLSLELIALTPDGRRHVADYREDLAARRGRSVIREIFGASARSGQEGFTTEAGHWFAERRDGLSETLVLADSTQPLPESAFIYPGPRAHEGAVPDSVVIGADAGGDDSEDALRTRWDSSDRPQVVSDGPDDDDDLEY